MTIIETRPREIGFVLQGHCQNSLDDLRTKGLRALTESLPLWVIFNCPHVSQIIISFTALKAEADHMTRAHFESN